MIVQGCSILSWHQHDAQRQWPRENIFKVDPQFLKQINILLSQQLTLKRIYLMVLIIADYIGTGWN